MPGQFCFQGGKHVFAARVAEDAGDRRPMAGGRAVIEVSYGTGGQARYGGMEQIPQLATALLKPDTVAVFWVVVRVERMASDARRARLRAPDAGRRAIPEQTGTDDDAGVIVEVERGRADFDRHAGDGGCRVGGQDTVDRPQGGDSRTAAESDQILKPRIVPQAQGLRNIATHARAKVTGAGAHHQGVDFVRLNPSCLQCGAECLGGQGGGRMTEFLVQFICFQREKSPNIADGELPPRDARVAAQNARKHEAGAAVQIPLQSRGAAHEIEALDLGQRVGWGGRGQSVEVHGAQWQRR